jgi:hypothetical protein
MAYRLISEAQGELYLHLLLPDASKVIIRYRPSTGGNIIRITDDVTGIANLDI